MLKHKKIIFFLGATILIVSLALFFTREEVGIEGPDNENTSSKAFSSNEELLQKRVPLKQLKYVPRKKVDKDQSSFSKDCYGPLSEVAHMTSEEHHEMLKSKEKLDRTLSPGCIENLSKNDIISRLSNAFKCDLTASFETLQTDDRDLYCTLFLNFLKIFFIADQTKNLSIDKKSSEELAANFLANMYTFLLTEEKKTLEPALNSIEALYGRHPHDENVAEGYFGFLNLANSREVIKKEVYEKKLSALLDHTRGKSYKLDRLNMIHHVTNKDYEGAKTVMDELNRHYPNKAEVQYYYAGYYWKKGDRDSSIKFLDKAISIESSCKNCESTYNYKEVKQNLEKAKIGQKGLFEMKVGAIFENL